jgi:hypothetical protein
MDIGHLLKTETVPHSAYSSDESASDYSIFGVAINACMVVDLQIMKVSRTLCI